MDPLTLKNLIGRAGRSTVEQNKFDYGYTIIKSKNLKSFCERINQNFNLEDTSKLDCEDNEVSEDNKDLVDAMKNNSFDGETRLTQQQIQRIQTSNFEETVAFLIDKLFIDDKIITGNHYYEKLSSSQRNQIKAAFKDLYTFYSKHLNTNITLAYTRKIFQRGFGFKIFLFNKKKRTANNTQRIS